MNAVLDFKGIAKSWGAAKAVDNVSFTADQGETVALLGPSGCGKTTTLRLIAGFETPDRGAILIDGENMVGKRPYERNVGLLFQHYALFPHMNVRENVAYGLKQRHWPKADIANRVAEMLALVQLDGFAERRTQQLSGGQQQRVALARVLATKPKLVLLDEPLSALDAKLREELGSDLKRILSAVGSTTIVVTHDQDEAMSLADRIIVMNRGQIDQQGSPSAIYARPATHFVASFIGRNNWLTGTLNLAKRGAFATVLTDPGAILTVGNPGLPDGVRVRVGIRPERIEMKSSGATTPLAGANQLSGQVIQATDMGAELHYRVTTDQGVLMVTGSSNVAASFAVGAAVVIAIRAEDCVLFELGNGQ